MLTLVIWNSISDTESHRICIYLGMLYFVSMFSPPPRTIIPPHYFIFANIVTCVFFQMEFRIIFFQVVKISPDYIETLLGSVIDTWSRPGRECLSMFLKISFKSLYVFYSSLHEISLLFGGGVRFIPRILWLFFLL